MHILVVLNGSGYGIEFKFHRIQIQENQFHTPKIKQDKNWNSKLNPVVYKHKQSYVCG